MNPNSTVFHRLQSVFQAAASLLPRLADASPERRTACVMVMEPYMDALPTRRPEPCPARARRRFQSFAQLSVDA